MDTHATWVQSQIPVVFLLAIVSFGLSTSVEFMNTRSQAMHLQRNRVVDQQFEWNGVDQKFEQKRVDHQLKDSLAVVAERGMQALRDREPGTFIRGMIDDDYDLVDFQTAALALAPQKNANAEFILGWLCEDGNLHGEDWADVMSPTVIKELGNKNLGLTINQVVAAHWYVLSSEHGSSASSVRLGRMLKSSFGGEHDYSLNLSAKYFKKGIAQGDAEAKVYFAYSYAYGEGVVADSAMAWKLLDEVIQNENKENSVFAISAALQIWKDGKLHPPAEFAQGAADAVEFARRYDNTMSKAELDNYYSYHGTVPDPYPQFRSDLATKIREDLLSRKKA